MGPLGGKAPDQLGWAIAISLALHLILVAVVSFAPELGLNKRREFFSPAYQVELVGPPSAPSSAPPMAAPPSPAPAKPAAKPVAKPAAKPAPKPKPAAEKKKPEKIRAKPKPPPKLAEAVGGKKDKAKIEKTKRIERLKAERAQAAKAERELKERMDRLKRQADERRRLEGAINRLERKAATAHNQTGGAFAPAATAGAASGPKTSLRFQVYYTELWQRIRRHWYLPEAFVGKARGLTAIVVLRIGRDGRLEKVWLEKSSGNGRFDSSAERAAKRAAPFPPLPAGYRGGSHEVGVRFRAEDLSNS